MKDIEGLIACRGGSVRIPNKNIKNFGGSSLLEIKIKQLLQVVPQVYVNSDSESILEIADKSGAIPVLRDSKYATSEVSINEVYAEVTKPVPHEHILFAHVTSPLVKISTIQHCINQYNNLPVEFDSVCTVQLLKKFIWYKGKSVNYDSSKMPRSQDLPNYHMIAFAINILPKELLLNLKNIVTNNYFPIELDEIEAMDIDDKIEFELAEYLYTK